MSPRTEQDPRQSADARRTQRILLQVPLIALAMKVRPGQKLFAEKLGYRQGTGVPGGTRARKTHRQK
jgi:hypothetical protein